MVVLKKRITSLLIVFCLLITMLPVTAFAAGGNGISADKTVAKAGEEFTVSLEIPPIADSLSNIEFNISFVNSVFEVIEYKKPAFAENYSTAADAISQEY